MNRNWVLKETDEEAVNSLHQELKINSVLCKLLVNRGVLNINQAKRFFRPSLDDLYDPFLMKDMDKAVKRIEDALVNDEKILVYGDYDVDGTTAVALVYSFFHEIYPKVYRYIPDRYEEGYGISFKSIDFAKQQGITLIIALDCGIKAEDRVLYAKEKGIDFIICDHHRPGASLPEACAVLDPKRDDCEYPYKELSGCGIGFKLLQAFALSNEVPFHYLEKFLDLVVVSIAADIVPITDENRVLSYYGLRRLNTEARPGLRALLESCGLASRELSISDIVFSLGPRINAAGRMGSGVLAVELLIADSDYEARIKAQELEQLNEKRRQIDKEITEAALDMLYSDPDSQQRYSTVLYHPGWHKGVIGIVASRLTETYYRPTIILTNDNGKVAGSARSVKGFDIYNALTSCEDLLIQYGGHKYAAGMTIEEANVPAFIQRFEEVVNEQIAEKLLMPEVLIDAELEIDELNPQFYKILNQFNPFGPGNLNPVFISRHVRDSGVSALVGQERSHIKLQVVQNGSAPMEGIGFNMSEKFEVVKEGIFDICYQVVENEFRGNKNLQLIVKDLKIPDEE
ncbi:MAG: single-stranded-DNA-specific exonuclease RecJ [Sphingobacteriales bacterium]|nr:single-stranded-DNA-specific exonuclease RecJ [Sphingobacteriales bacterium]